MQRRYPYEFDPKKRKRAEQYRRGKLHLYGIGLLVSLATLLSVLVSGLHLVIRDVSLHTPFPALANGLLVLAVLTVAQLPVTFYSTYVYEHAFHLSRYTLARWARDFLKFTLVQYAFALAMIGLLYASFGMFSPWWAYAGVAFLFLSGLMSYVFPVIVLPFLWKTEPYADEAMKRKLLRLCRKLGVTGIQNVVVIRESEKSVKPNAVFAGFGTTKQIGLYDTLLTAFTRDEIETVIGHELGHCVNKDIARSLLLEALLIFPLLFIIDRGVALFGPAFGVAAISDGASLALIALLYGSLNFMLMPITNSYSRHREAHADAFALEHVRKPLAQISAEKRLADMHLAELEAHPLTELWLLSHPPTIKRIRMAEEWEERRKKRIYS
ncbi:MAG: M48 family metalloprotease [Candidatus Aenigmarchaeota archaeon]|nr:M48 family metalloprotease [Candidatus Aenigmarchaeota archaeon]